MKRISAVSRIGGFIFQAPPNMNTEKQLPAPFLWTENTQGIYSSLYPVYIYSMDELLGICEKRGLGSRQDDRKSGNFGSHRAFFSVTPDKKIKIMGHLPGQFKIIDYSEFKANYKINEIPSFTFTQHRMQKYKSELKGAKALGEPLRDYKFKVKERGSEQMITIKQVKRTSAVKQIIKEFKKLDELYEWYDGDWLLIKKSI